MGTSKSKLLRNDSKVISDLSFEQQLFEVSLFLSFCITINIFINYLSINKDADNINTKLLIACQFDNETEKVKELLEQGADPKYVISFIFYFLFINIILESC